jgi:hypothetical protein
VIGRFGDVFGARAALSLSCVASIVFFLLLAIADTPAMLFMHKLPVFFMHVLPGKWQCPFLHGFLSSTKNLKPLIRGFV